jgi:hypothetical protein
LINIPFISLENIALPSINKTDAKLEIRGRDLFPLRPVRGKGLAFFCSEPFYRRKEEWP